MGKDYAEESEVHLLSTLAADPHTAHTTQTSYYDMMSYNLTKYDACDALLEWIRANKQIVRTIMRGKDSGSYGFEIWPKFNGKQFYCKYVIRENSSGQMLLIVSVHPDR